MNVYQLNETPVRTAKHFQINHINIEMEIPNKPKKQMHTIISEEIQKLQIDPIEVEESITSRLGLTLNANCGVNITVPKGSSIIEPIRVLYHFDKEHDTLIDHIKINYEEDSEASFIIYYSSETEEGFHYLKLETIAQKNAKGKMVLVNQLGKEVKNFTAIENHLAENAQVEFVMAELSGKNKVTNYYASLEGTMAENNIKTMYLGAEQDVLDLNYLIDMAAEHTKCNVLVQGALKGMACKNFKGTIDFKQGCIGAKGIENENCMLLSDKAIARSLPMLLCHEEDVEGEHGVSSGKVDENKLFYLMTRGLSEEEAKKLLVKANFNDVIIGVGEEDIKETILKMIDKI